METCLYCQHRVAAGALYCPHCRRPQPGINIGAPKTEAVPRGTLIHPCPACGEHLPAGARFCGRCGHPQLGDVSHTTRVLPPTPPGSGWQCSACGGIQPLGARFCGDCGRSAEQEEELEAVVLVEEEQGETRTETAVIVPLAPGVSQTGTPHVPTVSGLPQTGTPSVPTASGSPQLGAPSVPSVPGAPQTGTPSVPSVPGGPQTGTPSVPSVPGGPQTGGAPPTGGPGSGAGAGSPGPGGGAPGRGGTSPGNGPGNGGGPGTSGASSVRPTPGSTPPPSGQGPTLPGGGTLAPGTGATLPPPPAVRVAPAPQGSGQPPKPIQQLPPKRHFGCFPRVLLLVPLLLILIPAGIYGYFNVQASSKLQVHPDAFSQACTGDASLPPLQATLDNGAKGTSIEWRVSLQDTDPAGQPWATLSPTSGTIPAGKSATLTITPADSLCQDIAQALAPVTFTATVTTGNASLTLTDTVSPTPVIKFDAAPVMSAQMCDDTQALPALSVTLDNTGSNLPVEWQVALTATDPAGIVWATATPTSGRVEGAQSGELTLTPEPTVCADMMHSLSPIDYTAVLTYTALGKQDSLTVTDTIAPPIVVDFHESPMMTSQTCAIFQALPALPVTLDNTGSNVPVDWQVSITDKDPAGQVWATANTAHGTVAAQQKGGVTFTPSAGLCRHLLGSGVITYSVTITYTASGKPAQRIVVTDTIAPPAPVNNFRVAQTSFNQRCGGRSSILGAIKVTLDNSNSTVPVTWKVTITALGPFLSAQEIITPSSGGVYLWASASPASGTIPAAQRATLTMTPDSAICPDLFDKLAPFTYSATVSYTALGQTHSVTVRDTVQSPPPTASLRGSPTNFNQSCSTGFLADMTVTLDTFASNVPVQWSISITDTDPQGFIWASASPTSGVLNPGDSGTLTLFDDNDGTLCEHILGGTFTFSAVITFSSSIGQGGTIIIKDTIVG